jgi:adenosylcobinamide-phosphate synthase
VAPLFYLVVGGVPLAMVYKAINTLDSMIGYKHGQYLWFGRIAAKTDDIANFIPARITALLIFLLSPLVRQNPVNTMKSISLYAKKHPSPNAGWPESAMAGALNISLGGPSNYNNMLHKKEWIGDGSQDPSYNDIKNSVKMLYSVSITIFFTAIIISAIL